MSAAQGHAAPPPASMVNSAVVLVLQYVRDSLGDEAVAELLRRAGEDRDVSELEDERAWSPFEKAVALLEAAAALTGHPDVGYRVGAACLRRGFGAWVRPLVALGSPGPVLRAAHYVVARASTATAFELLELGRGRATAALRVTPGLAPARPICEMGAGILSQVPVAFGLPPATVGHARCQALGDEACRFELSWAERSRLPWRRRRQREEERRLVLAGLAQRIEDLQASAADLVSTDDLPAVLDRIAARAGAAVGAERFVLAVHPQGQGGAPVVCAGGLGETEAAGIVAALAGPGPAGLAPEALVAPVASARRHYGWVVALPPASGATPGVSDGEGRLLGAYARHAAAALDAAAALAEVARGRETAEALLASARALVDADGTDDVARRLVEAAVRLVGAADAALLAWEPAAEALVLHDATEAPGLRPGRRLRTGAPALARLTEAPGGCFYGPDSAGSDGDSPLGRGILELLGAERAAAVPLVVRGRFLGVLAVGWRGPVDPARDPEVRRRLAGLADHGATALDNARLVEQVRHQALHDGLTGLPNAALFEDRVGHALAAASRSGKEVGLLFCDLDRFKAVNDTYGHRAGDELLREVARRLRAVVRPGDTTCRLGGDEFAVLLPDLASPADAAAAAEKVLGALRQPLVVAGGHVAAVTPSVGVAVHPHNGTTYETLLAAADAAMYRAKEKGRNATATATG